MAQFGGNQAEFWNWFLAAPDDRIAAKSPPLVGFVDLRSPVRNWGILSRWYNGDERTEGGSV